MTSSMCTDEYRVWRNCDRCARHAAIAIVTVVNRDMWLCEACLDELMALPSTLPLRGKIIVHDRINMPQESQEYDT